MSSGTPVTSPPPHGIRRLWHSLRGQLIGLVAAAVMGSMALHGGYTIAEQSSLARESLASQASALARNLAAASENAILTGRLDVMEALILNSVGFADVRAIQVFDARGTRLGHVARRAGEAATLIVADGTRHADLPARPLPQLRTTGRDATTGIEAWHPVIAGSLIGWVRVDYGTDSLAAISRRIWTSTLLGGSLAVLTTGLLLWLLLRRPMRALDASRRFAIGLQDVRGQQLPDVGGPLEIRELGAALNEASSRLFTLRRDGQAAIERLQAIFALSPDGLAGFDGDGHLTYANQAFYRMTGLDPGDPASRQMRALDARLRARCANPDEHPDLEACFAPPSADGLHRPAPPTPSGRHRLTLSRPAHAVLEIAGRQGDSHATQRVLHLRDVTHETELERMKSEFVASAAHELRTPLTSIHGFTELMLHREFEPARRQQMLTRIHRQSVAMTAIVDQLLDLSRIETRRDADFARAAIDLGRLVSEVVDGFQPPAARAAPMLTIGADALRVKADPARIAQVLRALLANAYQYSAAPQPVRVSLSADAQDGVELAVTDEGIGMTAAQAARVFERFYRADPSGNLPGSGLGLSIAREIVELHGGTISLDSTPGTGTTVRVRLPAAPPSPVAPAECPPADSTQAQPALGSCTTALAISAEIRASS